MNINTDRHMQCIDFNLNEYRAALSAARDRLDEMLDEGEEMPAHQYSFNPQGSRQSLSGFLASLATLLFCR